jgi:phosphatidylglycerophosphatase A
MLPAQRAVSRARCAFYPWATSHWNSSGWSGRSLAVWSAGRAGTDWEVTDHPAIVIDEVVGVWLAYLIPITLLAVEFDSIHLILIALVLFRLYDIVKPWPVNWVERRLPGGAGVVADDLVAGAMAGFTAVIVLIAQSVV